MTGYDGLWWVMMGSEELWNAKNAKMRKNEIAKKKFEVLWRVMKGYEGLWRVMMGYEGLLKSYEELWVVPPPHFRIFCIS